MSAGRTDANGEDAAQHIRNALQVLSFATPLNNGTCMLAVTFSAMEVAGLRDRLRKALALLEPEPKG